MRRLLILILLLFTCSIYGSYFKVPGFDYSVYFPLGFQLQEYSEESELSWFSLNRDVAFTVKSFPGETYSSTSQMVNNLTKNINGTKEFANFIYNGMDASIADITFTHKGLPHRGWFVMLNGDDFDYYIYSYSFESDYEKALSLILSALDSFSPGKEGESTPGLISSFYTYYSSRNTVVYEIDLFGHIVPLKMGQDEFESSQNLIEREALIMEGYGYYPDLFYNAWIRYFRMIFRDNHKRFEAIYNSISPYIERDKYNDYELVELLMFWIQGYKYERRENTSSDMINPLEASILGVGDCDSRVMVLNLLLSYYEIDSIMLVSEKVKHSIAGVKVVSNPSVDVEETVFRYNGYEYLGIELTKMNLIGEIEEIHRASNIWTFVDLDFSSSSE